MTSVGHESDELGEPFDIAFIAQLINEEHGETLRDLADCDGGTDAEGDSFSRATRLLRELHEQTAPESAQQAVGEVAKLRESEGHIDQTASFRRLVRRGASNVGG